MLRATGHARMVTSKEVLTTSDMTTAQRLKMLAWFFLALVMRIRRSDERGARSQARKLRALVMVPFFLRARNKGTVTWAHKKMRERIKRAARASTSRLPTRPQATFYKISVLQA